MVCKADPHQGDATHRGAAVRAREKGRRLALQSPLELVVRAKGDTCEVDTGDGQRRAMGGASLHRAVGAPALAA